MKKFKSIYILFAVATVSLTACKKSFLDEKPPSAVPVPDAIKTESDLSDAVNGMYASMRSTSSFGTNVPVLGDILADNAYVSASNSGYFLAEQNYNLLAGNAEAAAIYGQCYYSILQANRIIYYAATLPQSNNVLELKGEAYTSRALNYLTLVSLFAKPYTADPNALGVPLITTPTNLTSPAIKPARATVGTVYNKIISDLDSAFAIMPAASTTLHAVNSDYISKYAAKAIESRAYLYKGDYANARDAALSVVQNGGYNLVASTGLQAYWSNAGPTTKSETIFELELNSATNNGTAGMEYFYVLAGYGQNMIYQDLYNQYSATDARKGLLLTGVSAKGIVLNKYTNTSNPDRDNIKIIRYAEVLLTLAEGYARTGSDVNALIYLNQLAKQRDPSFVGYASAGTQLQNDIVAERRKELVGEGLRLADLNRLKLDINRPAQTGVIATIQNIPFTDFRRLLPIPQAEVDANSSTVQNPGY